MGLEVLQMPTGGWEQMRPHLQHSSPAQENEDQRNRELHFPQNRLQGGQGSGLCREATLTLGFHAPDPVYTASHQQALGRQDPFLGILHSIPSCVPPHLQIETLCLSGEGSLPALISLGSRMLIN